MAEMLQESGHYRDCAHKHIHGVCCSCKYRTMMLYLYLNSCSGCRVSGYRRWQKRSAETIIK